MGMVQQAKRVVSPMVELDNFKFSLSNLYTKYLQTWQSNAVFDGFMLYGRDAQCL